jgi:hypothetical protein
MRTTLIIPDSLFHQVKHLAVKRRTSLSQIINDALRKELQEPTEGKKGVKIPVFGGGMAEKVDTSPAELDAFLNEEGGL